MQFKRLAVLAACMLAYCHVAAFKVEKFITATAGAGTGDIEGVTAGTNVNGGGTTGTVTINLNDAISLSNVTCASCTVTGDKFSVGGATFAVTGGVVGIGTTAPDTANGNMLELKTTVTNNNATLTLDAASGAGAGRIEFQQAGTGNAGLRSYGTYIGLYRIDSGMIRMGAGGVNDQVVITSAGYMGIGTTAPTVALDLYGDFKTSGTLTSTSANSFLAFTNSPAPITSGGTTVGTVYNSTAALALRVVLADFAGPDVVMGAATNTIVNVATAAYNKMAWFDPNISSGPSNGVLFKWRAPEDLGNVHELTARDFGDYIGSTDTVSTDISSRTYVLAINVFSASSERPTSFALPINITVLQDANGVNRDNEFAADTTLTGWAAAITPGAMYWIYAGRLGGSASLDPSTMGSYGVHFSLTGVRSATQ